MILIGQYDSPFTRRVAIALRLYGLAFEHRPWSTFGDADKIAPFNPFTDTPVKGVNWDLNPNFGTPLNAFAYTSPRIVRFSVGLRF